MTDMDKSNDLVRGLGLYAGYAGSLVADFLASPLRSVWRSATMDGRSPAASIMVAGLKGLFVTALGAVSLATGHIVAGAFVWSFGTIVMHTANGFVADAAGRSARERGETLPPGRAREAAAASDGSKWFPYVIVSDRTRRLKSEIDALEARYRTRGNNNGQAPS